MGIFSRVNAQFQQNLDVEIEAGVIYGEENKLPFWLHTNKNGLVDRSGSNGYLWFSGEKRFENSSPVNFTIGMELISRWSEKSAVFFNEGYVQAEWKNLQLIAGRKIETIGIQDTSLTIGSMIFSQNASPIPKISIGTAGFAEIPGTNGWLSVNAYLSHGWLEKDRFVDKPFLHQKYLYARVSPENIPLQLYGGITHSVIWAGHHPELGNLPDGIDDFWLIFTAQSSDAEDAEPSAGGEALGSSVGTYDFGISLAQKGVRGLVYRKFYLETGAGAKFRNPWDGLWGASVSWNKYPQIINGIIWEHLYTRRQSSKTGQGDPPFGSDSYYNNGTYRSGWTYHGQSLGNPLLFSDGIFPGVDNNIVIAHHVGLQGSLGFASYKAFVTYSRNYGARDVCIDEACDGRVDRVTERLDQYSIVLESFSRVKNQLLLRLNLAYDIGGLYEDRLGIQAGLLVKLN